MTALQGLLCSILLDGDAYRLSRCSRHARDLRMQKNVDALVLEQAPKSLTHVFVFARHQPLVAVDHRHGTPESAHRLGQLDADVAAADYKQVGGHFVEFERLDVREWLRVSQTRNGSQRGPRPGTDDHVRATQVAAGPVGESDLRRARSDEPSGAHNELRSRVPVIVQIHLVQARHHRALAVTDARHRNREAVVSDAELVTAAKVRGDLRTVDDVFAGQARDVRTRSTNVFALDDCDALSVSSKRPRSDSRPRAAPEHHQVKCFRLCLRNSLGGWRVLQALHATCPFRATGSLLACMDLTRSAADAPSSASPSPTSRTMRSCNGCMKGMRVLRRVTSWQYTIT